MKKGCSGMVIEVGERDSALSTLCSVNEDYGSTWMSELVDPTTPDKKFWIVEADDDTKIEREK
jgi:hypothetical protein